VKFEINITDFSEIYVKTIREYSNRLSRERGFRMKIRMDAVPAGQRGSSAVFIFFSNLIHLTTTRV
jgi:hypothetical protein